MGASDIMRAMRAVLGLALILMSGHSQASLQEAELSSVEDVTLVLLDSEANSELKPKLEPSGNKLDAKDPAVKKEIEAIHAHPMANMTEEVKKAENATNVPWSKRKEPKKVVAAREEKEKEQVAQTSVEEKKESSN